ncbi:MAG: hypothetical protein JNK87_27295, partial [Bryobacterales bacterium]|nr:hypothetical protein [Bryobacterales bacterium]
VNILRGQAASWINFSYRGTTVKAGDFTAVATALEKNKIYMDIDNYKYRNGAEYWPANTTINGCKVTGRFVFGMGSSDLSRVESKALLIHEAVHAALDMRSQSSITVLRSECVAYIAQQLWHKAVTTEWLPDAGHKFKHAATCAGYFWDAKQPAEGDMLMLEAAIMGDKEYGWKVAWEKTGYDG